ncbi:hypothetical protein FNU76_10160 [Chitinimonas arctica]|uniref:Uncharacterized protein n=1 Tax=Chitinimonas arctica TaxID=2594795 RepID=A0A516SEW4_9NEIS|nr:hypothetical protein [Chitinimonas arctica]QDQ26697.1 hypothetical protein FNU76_10160 [Chitinimonas arctica]
METYLREVMIVCNPDGSIRGAHRKRGASQLDAFTGATSELEGPAEALALEGTGSASLASVVGEVTAHALLDNEALRTALATAHVQLEGALQRIAQLEQAQSTTPAEVSPATVEGSA